MPDATLALVVAEAGHVDAARRAAVVQAQRVGFDEVGAANVRILAEPPRDAVERVDVEREADFDGRLALAEMLRNYRGRAEESRDLYRQLDRDYPHRSDFPENR